MSALAPDPGWTLVIVGLALLALLLFGLAVRFGRWGVWLAGYLCVLLAVLAAIIAAQRGEPGEPTPAGPGDSAQPSVRSGVLHPVDRIGYAPSGPWVIDEVI